MTGGLLEQSGAGPTLEVAERGRAASVQPDDHHHRETLPFVRVGVVVECWAALSHGFAPRCKPTLPSATTHNSVRVSIQVPVRKGQVEPVALPTIGRVGDEHLEVDELVVVVDDRALPERILGKVRPPLEVAEALTQQDAELAGTGS